MDENKNNINNIFPKLVVCVFFLLLGFWAGRYVEIPFLPNNQAKINVAGKVYSKDNVDFATFWQVWDTLNKDFLFKKDLSGQKLLQGAIKGLVTAAGDPYTAYFDPDANKSFTDEISGTFEGVGMELGFKDNKLVVIAPLADSPAEKAGIKPLDQIVTIDNKDATTMSVNDAAKLIRGKSGTKVTVVFIRSSVADPIKIELTRAQITVKTVKSTIVNDTATISISRFGDNTNSEWDSAVNEITTKGIKKVILDLRNDPGGLLDDAIHVAGDFLTTKDVVLQQEDANGNRQPYYNTTDGRLQGVQVIILVNKGSASASEIVTGALHDHKKAKIVGETSFGKGTVQTVNNLGDGSGLHITIAKWLTPNGTWVHGKGIEPDFKVDLTDQNVKDGVDSQMEKAIELLK
jgi:carboxyl-terminal processing protease